MFGIFTNGNFDFWAFDMRWDIPIIKEKSIVFSINDIRLFFQLLRNLVYEIDRRRRERGAY